MKSESSCRNTRRFPTSLGRQLSITSGMRDGDDELHRRETKLLSATAKTLEASLASGVAREAGTLLRAQHTLPKIAARSLVLHATLKLLLTDVRIAKLFG
jgi:hypothetical protein